MFSPPTDSLYKFIAIFGLIILAWGVAFPWQKAQEFKFKLIEIKAEVKANNNISKRINASYQLLIKERNLIKSDDPERDLKEAAIDKRKQEMYIQLIETQLPVDEKVETLKVVKNSLTIYKMLGWFSICAGFILMISGFLLWYKKLQKHIDTKMQNGAG
jgi:hypothetical protein